MTKKLELHDLIAHLAICNALDIADEKCMGDRADPQYLDILEEYASDQAFDSSYDV